MTGNQQAAGVSKAVGASQYPWLVNVDYALGDTVSTASLCFGDNGAANDVYAAIKNAAADGEKGQLVDPIELEHAFGKLSLQSGTTISAIALTDRLGEKTWLDAQQIDLVHDLSSAQHAGKLRADGKFKAAANRAIFGANGSADAETDETAMSGQERQRRPEESRVGA